MIFIIPNTNKTIFYPFLLIGLFFLPLVSIADTISNTSIPDNSDTSRANEYFKLAMEIRTKDSVRARNYARLMLDLSEKANYKTGKAKAYYVLGRISHDNNDHEKSIRYLEKSVAIAKESKYEEGILDGYYWIARCYRRIADYNKYKKYLSLLEKQALKLSDKEYLSFAYEGYGNLYRYLGDYPTSLNYYMKAIALSEELGNLEDVSGALNNMSLIYDYQGNSEEELKIQMRNYEILTRLDDKKELVLCLSNISGIYNDLGLKEKSKEYIDKAIRMIEEEGPENIPFKNVGSVYVQYAGRARDEGNYDMALKYYNNNLELKIKHGEVKGISEAYGYLAEVYQITGDNEKAEEFFLKQLSISNEIGYVNGAMNACLSLAGLKESLYDYESAYNFQKEYLRLKDSVAIETSSKQTEKMEAWFKVKDQQQSIELLSAYLALQEAELKKRNTILYALIAGFLLILVIAIIMYKSYLKLKTAKAQLQFANQELESFSYSVSHDLRAPLRAIGNYSTMIQEDYEKELGQEGNRMLGLLKENTEKMNQLINDLLAFSRLGRKELDKTIIDMNDLFTESLNELNKAMPHHAEVSKGILHTIKGDYGLMKQVVINLLSNAIKYSSKSVSPLIEISSEKINNEIVYSIKDNGVGFDMNYVKKLFGVFQRLHSPEEFEGTGVGLAIVQRIILKHGGRVWAEAEKNKGAIFHFALPAS